MDDFKTFIFIGSSGSGKGTQRVFLEEYLKETEENKKVLTIETGEKFREFIQGDRFANKLSQEIMAVGDLQPGFLAIRMWSDFFIEELEGNEHLLLDGTPRMLREAYILDNALDFFRRKKVYIVFINVSRQWSMDRLADRGRLDDDLEGVKKRLDWYQKNVAPTVEHYRFHKDYTFVEINGEQTIEEVKEEMLGKIKNLT